MAKQALNAHLCALAALLLVTGCYPVAVGPHGDFSAPLANNYSLVQGGCHHVLVMHNGFEKKPLISEKIVELDHDSTWVIAKQQHMVPISPDTPNQTHPKPNEFSYWILNTELPKVWGPFSHVEFERQRVLLNVTPSLVLRNFESYRPR